MILAVRVCMATVAIACLVLTGCSSGTSAGRASEGKGKRGEHGGGTAHSGGGGHVGGGSAARSAAPKAPRQAVGGNLGKRALAGAQRREGSTDPLGARSPGSQGREHSAVSAPPAGQRQARAAVSPPPATNHHKGSAGSAAAGKAPTMAHRQARGTVSTAAHRPAGRTKKTRK